MKAPAEFKTVRLRECPVDSPQMDNPETVAKFWREHIVTAAWFRPEKECLVVFLLNTRNRHMGFEMLSQGTKDTLLVNHAEIFRLAAIHNAAKVVIAHNHPSGDPRPSEADVKITLDLIKAGRIMKIELLDHVIIGAEAHRPGHCSLLGLGYFFGGAGESEAEESATSPEASAPKKPTPVAPSQVAAETQAALTELDRAGSAAVACALMNAEMISEASQSFADWEYVDAPIFARGAMELAGTVTKQFDDMLAKWMAFQGEIIKRVSGFQNPILPASEHRDSAMLPALQKQYPHDAYKFETAVGSLRHCIQQQGWMMDKRELHGSLFLSDEAETRLAKAFDSAWAAQIKLNAVFHALEAANLLTPAPKQLAA